MFYILILRNKLVGLSKFELSVILGVILSVILCGFAPFYENNIKHIELHPNVLKLSIITASNSTEYQEIKLKIRDEILSNSHKALQNTIDDKIQIENMVNKTLKDYNLKPKLEINLNKNTLKAENTPTQIFSVPSLKYTELSIKIGDITDKNSFSSTYSPIYINSPFETQTHTNEKETENEKNTITNYKMQFATFDLFKTITDIFYKPEIASKD